MPFRNLHFEIPSHAKTNPYLRVVRRESTGLHVLRSIVFQLELSDLIELDIVHGNGRVEVVTTFSSELKDHIDMCEKNDPVGVEAMLSGLLGSRNLVQRAVEVILEELRACLSYINFDIRINLLKCVPFGAGLGGGSSNAATIARVLPEAILSNFSGIGEDERNSAKLCAERRVCALGSDIPALFVGCPVFLLGTGNVVLPLCALEESEFWKNLSVVVVKPPCSVSTPDAYSWLNFPKGELGFNEDANELLFETEQARIVAQSLSFDLDVIDRGISSLKDFSNEKEFAIRGGLTMSTSVGNSDRPSSREVSQLSASPAFPCGVNPLGSVGHLAAGLVYNDFESVVFRKFPLVCEAKLMLQSCGAVAVFLSGSGSAVVGVFQSVEEVGDATARLVSLRDRGFFVDFTRFVL